MLVMNGNSIDHDGLFTDHQSGSKASEVEQIDVKGIDSDELVVYLASICDIIGILFPCVFDKLQGAETGGHLPNIACEFI